MMRNRTCLGLGTSVAVLTAFLANSALAADDPTLKEILRELQQLKAENQRLQSKLQAVESKIGDASRDAADAKSQASDAKSQASEAKSQATEAKTTAVTAKDQADQSKSVIDQVKAGKLKVGPANFSLAGSWIEGVAVVRAHNEFASPTGSAVNSPFANAASYHTREFRLDTRSSRFNMSVYSDPFDDGQQLKGRLQFDWMNNSNNTTQNNNAWTPRLRLAYGEWDLNRSGWHFAFGQAYSLTLNQANYPSASGGPAPADGWKMLPGNENFLADVDAIMAGQTGLTRQAQFRVVKEVTHNAAVAVSLESNTVTWGGTTAGITSGALSGAASGSGSTGSGMGSNGSTAAYAASGYVNTSSLGSLPNVVVKATYQPDPNLLMELYGIGRSYKNIKGVTSATDTGSVAAGGIGAAAYVKIIPGVLDFAPQVGFGSLGGLDISGAIPDVTTNNLGKPVPVHELTGYFGLYYYPSKDLTLINYTGFERGFSAGVSGTNSGYGNRNNLNTGCKVVGGVCNGNTETAFASDIAALWRVYNGKNGRVEVQPQFTYVRETKFRDARGVGASTDNFIYTLGFRYFPF